MTQAFLEAWAWLEHQGLIINVTSGAEIYELTRRGRKIADAGAFQTFRNASRFPKELLHPRLQQAIGTHFVSGDYETAVFKAFREVEIAVRSAIDESLQHLVGVPLVSEAFHVDKGALRDSKAHSSEREAMVALFRGAMGLFKNSVSHREVRLESKEAIEMLMIAMYLLRVVDERTKRA
ncbi:MAG: TIGR02391 family protein [Vicinamibacterales bacterium]